MEYIEYQNPLSLNIDECDMLFINTWNSHEIVTGMLEKFGNRAHKFIAVHNTHTYAAIDEKVNWQDFRTTRSLPNEGIIAPLINFTIKNRHWRFKEHKTNNNGLTVLERV